MTADSGHPSTTGPWDTPRASPTPAPSARDADPPLVDRLAREEPLTWWNPAVTDTAHGLADSGIDPGIVADAAARLERFRPWIAAAFPDTAAAGGLIESPVQRADAWREAAGISNGRVLLKRDDVLPVSGSVKARGGVHEVLQYAESLAVQHGLLPDPAHAERSRGTTTSGAPAARAPEGRGAREAQERRVHAALSSAPFRRLMGEHRVVVGSTGNLGLSIGIVSAALGLQATVHVSTHAQQWKKDLLRSRGVEVVEHATDYTQAVAAGREAADGDDSVHFVDDEHSLSLFAGYAVAGARVARQLCEQDITVDAGHPLYVYLPCGIGGAPGGVAYGLKREFGDAVHCVFVEPTQAPCMLLGLSTGRHDRIAVAEIGLGTRTVADGLAVGRPSGFVGRAVQGLVAGCVTATDEQMMAQLRSLHATESIIVEPSAAAALEAVRRIAGFSCRGAAGSADPGAGSATGAGKGGTAFAGATHLAWLTGGGMVPAGVRAGYVG